MKEFFGKIIASLDTHTKGFSARKLTAAVTMLCVIVGHAIWLKHCLQKDDFSLWPEVLMIDFGFIGVCLGMTTYEKIKTNAPRKNEPTVTEP